MNTPTPVPDWHDRDGLRLLGLSRIPLCSTCPRLAALERARAGQRPGPLAPPPEACHAQFCAPLLVRAGLIPRRGGSTLPPTGCAW